MQAFRFLLVLLVTIGLVGANLVKFEPMNCKTVFIRLAKDGAAVATKACQCDKEHCGQELLESMGFSQKIYISDVPHHLYCMPSMMELCGVFLPTITEGEMTLDNESEAQVNCLRESCLTTTVSKCHPQLLADCTQSL